MLDRNTEVSRQLIIGLDAMEWDLVKKWAQRGKLPTFRRLMDQGLQAELRTTSEQLPDTVWASIYTGTNPAKFEKYYYVQYDPATKWLKHVPDDAIHQTPFWEYLSDAGQCVGVVDAPKFPMSPSLNGFQVTNWGAHATKTARRSNPPNLLAEVEARFGRHPVGDCDAVDPNPASLKNLRRRVLEGVKVHGEMFRWLMRDRRWDVFFASFSEPHCAGHHFYHYVDPDHPRYTTEDQHGLADSLEQVYRAVDREIGEMLAAAGEGVRTMVFAGHGMGPLYHASWSLTEMLELLGYGRRQASRPAQKRTAKTNFWRTLKRVLPGRLQYAIKAMLPKPLQDQLLFLWYAGGADWNGCRAFAVPNNDSVGAIRLAVKGRDKNGLVSPGLDYRRICEEIAAALYELTDPESGRRVVRRVTLTHDLFDGPYLDQLPDITVLWEQSFPWNSVQSPRFGTLQGCQNDARSGSHTGHGFLLSAGPGIPQGAKLTGASTYDIAPTVLETAGVAIPEYLDGHPLRQKVLAA